MGEMGLCFMAKLCIILVALSIGVTIRLIIYISVNDIELSRYEIVPAPPVFKLVPIIIIFEMLTDLYICSVLPNKI